MKKWIFEPGHSSAEFCARHMMVTNVRGHFKNVEGFLSFDPEKPLEGEVEATIDATSIWSGDKDRDAHLRNEDFLHVEEHPEIVYRGSDIEPHGCQEFTVHGELTIRGITKSVPLEARYLGLQETPYWEDGEDRGPVSRIGFHGETSINRHEFDVSWQGDLPGGGVVVSDTVWITLDVEALPATFLDSS